MIYFIASIIIVLINVFPAFMPPTWTVISYIHIRYEINLFAMAVIGAMSSSFGRLLLARISRFSVPRIFAEEIVDNMKFIGSKLEGRSIKMFLVGFLWALAPVGSNPLFIAVGLAGAKIRYVLAGFFIGRSINYFSLAYASKILVDGIRSIFFEGIFDWRRILLNSFTVIFVVLYLLLDWQTLILDKKIRFGRRLFKKRNRS